MTNLANNPKDSKIRHSEYYEMTEEFDSLYQKATQSGHFSNLMDIIASKDNVLLAYRNIKRNKGSHTASIDGITIRDLEKMSQQKFISFVQKRFRWYMPRKVRRKSIPKPNGKMRPLGIPSIWDRIAQQCVLQVLEPICEAHFCTRSYGFRPNWSAENAIADCAMRINQQNLHYVVDVDIKSFFDEVNHSKLISQLWTLGIRDRKLLKIIKLMMKAPIVMEDRSIVIPTKGTPQGGILSPLLANVNLNEFDWWISNQWETTCVASDKIMIRDGRKDRTNQIKQLSKTKLKQVYIVRYADDFKLLTDTKSNAIKLYHASKNWLEERLKLPISDEKSKITNLRKQKSEFLGFTLKVVKKGSGKWKKHVKKKGNLLPKEKRNLYKNGERETKFIMESDISPKALKQIRTQLKERIKKIAKAPNSIAKVAELNKFNSMVIGIHNYYELATNVSLNLRSIGRDMDNTMRNRLRTGQTRSKTTKEYTRNGSYAGKDKGILKYFKQNKKALRYYMERPVIPVSLIQSKPPMMKKNSINKYTPEGRSLIHKKLENGVAEGELRWLRNNPITGIRGSIELNDNRISLYVAQVGKCMVSGIRLNPHQMHVHHKNLWSQTKDDSYKNLAILHPRIHQLVHATSAETIRKIIKQFILTDKQIDRLNKLRELVGNATVSQLPAQ